MTFYGIYKITNLLNGKMYIGQHTTSNLDDGYMGSGVVIQRAIKKYGKENFRKEWLMFCEDKEELNYMERVYIDQTWVDRSDTYNLKTGGDQGVSSDESRKKLSKSLKMYYSNGGTHCMKGKHHTGEAKKKISQANKGRPAWNKGKSTPMEVIIKQSEAHKGTTAGQKNGMYDVHRFGKDNPNFGRKWTEEQKRKQSERLKKIKSGQRN